MSQTYTLTMATHLNTRDSCYEKIVTVDREPVGPLAQQVKRLNPVPLSPFETGNAWHNPCGCVYAIKSFSDCNTLMSPNEISQLYGFLVASGYKIDTSITKMTMQSEVRFANPLICFITYTS